MRRLLSTVETLAALSLLVIALLTATNVAVRYAFGWQIPDWFDGTQMLLGIAMFWGIALATWYGTHIAVDLLWEAFGARGKRVIDVLATLITVVFLVPLAWMVWVKVGGTGNQGTMDLRLPLKWFYSAAALGATVAAVLAVARLVLLPMGRAASAHGQDEAEGAVNGS
ncbi:MAG: TRAP transporter small permease [Hydrogenophaga sp.]|uniref:TRAP transporter small permease n=1 Tax=Hydrogenophaga sp. TaxID=1904254 RepID=UPI001DAD6605|nr:TRAP transporter small permease [Hydrogenophaga sp.]MBX3608717.1 TRAP transporter small permease [Hydrogenophaga sp.]